MSLAFDMNKAPRRSAPSRVREMRAEYRLDYQVARPNRFAGTADRDSVVITLDPDVAAVFSTSEAVNSLLRSVIASLPSVASTDRGVKRRGKTK